MKQLNNFYLLNYLHTMESNSPPSPFLEKNNVIPFASFNFLPFAGMFYVLDLTTGKYLYLSSHLDVKLQHHYNPLMEGGLEYFYNIVNKEDILIQDGLIRNHFAFIQNIPSVEKNKYCFNSNYRIHTSKKEYIHLWQRYIILESDTKGNPLVIAGVCADITSYKSNNLIFESITRLDEKTGMSIVSSSTISPEQNPRLTKREMEVVKMLCDGLNTHEIANKLYISYHTAKTHRKNIYLKTNCSNTADLCKQSHNFLL